MDDKKWKKKFSSGKGKGELINIHFNVKTVDIFGRTMMSYAAEYGNLEIAQFLVRQNCDPNVENSDGSKPLHIAVQYGQVNVVEFLIKIGASVNGWDKNKCTPLHYLAATRDISPASRAIHQDLIHILLQNNAFINAKNINSCTPLLLAAQSRQKHMVELFIKSGADLKCKDEEKWTVLHYACQNGWLRIVRTLIDLRCKIDLNPETPEGMTPVAVAASRYHRDIVKLLIESDIDLERDGGGALLRYVSGNRWFEVIDTLVKRKCNLNVINNIGKNALNFCAFRGLLNVVEYLIKCGADVTCVDIEGCTLLHYSCANGWLDLVKYLMHSCDVNAKDKAGNTPIIWAVRKKKLHVIQYLIDCGADVKTVNESGLTLLHRVCFRGWLEVVKTLVSKGCDINAKDELGKTPALFAADNFHLEVILYLVECGAELDCSSVKSGMTLLHHACVSARFGDFYTLVQILVKKGCSINIKDVYGVTPLRMAFDFRFESAVEFLIKQGADVEISNGKTLLHHACKYGWIEMVNLFIKLKLDLNARSVNHETPLVLAIQNFSETEHRQLEVIKQLLIAGADPNVVNDQGETAFHMFLRKSHSLEVVKLFLRNGWMDIEDYTIICSSEILKVGVLQNVEICTRVLINKFNFVDLPKIYNLASVILLPIEHLQITSQGLVQDIVEYVKLEIESKGYCNVLNARPIVLRRLCVLALVNHYNK